MKGMGNASGDDYGPHLLSTRFPAAPRSRAPQAIRPEVVGGGRGGLGSSAMKGWGMPLVTSIAFVFLFTRFLAGHARGRPRQWYEGRLEVVGEGRGGLGSLQQSAHDRRAEMTTASFTIVRALSVGSAKRRQLTYHVWQPHSKYGKCLMSPHPCSVASDMGPSMLAFLHPPGAIERLPKWDIAPQQTRDTGGRCADHHR